VIGSVGSVIESTTMEGIEKKNYLLKLFNKPHNKHGYPNYQEVAFCLGLIQYFIILLIPESNNNFECFNMKLKLRLKEKKIIIVQNSNQLAVDDVVPIILNKCIWASLLN